eukprot:c8572_g1_i1 orf=95-307(+)
MSCIHREQQGGAGWGGRSHKKSRLKPLSFLYYHHGWIDRQRELCSVPTKPKHVPFSIFNFTESNTKTQEK